LSKQVEYEIYTFGEQIVVMPMSEIKNKEWAKWWWAMWEYAKNAVYQKLAQLLPCDFLLSIKSASKISVYIPESYRARVIWKAGSKIQEIEKWLRLKIDLHSFSDLKLLDIQVKTQLEKNKSMQIRFPETMRNKTVCLLIWDELLYLNTNTQAHVNVTKKSDVKLLSNKWFVVVDWENM
jgi:ATPase